MASAAAVTPLGLLHMRLTSALATNLVSRTHFPRDSTSMVHSSEEGPPLSGARHHMAPVSRSVEPPRVARGRDMADLSGLPLAVVETITQARAPSTRQTYELKWSLFANWCSSRWEGVHPEGSLPCRYCQAVTTKERLEAVFHWRSKSLLISVGKGTAAWLSPAPMYSVVPAGTKVSEFALGQWEGCNLLHGICLSHARLSTSACHKVVTGFSWWRERRRYVPIPQSWTIAGCQGLVLGSSA